MAKWYPISNNAYLALYATHTPFRFTYEIAPVFILMEHFVLEKMRHIIGFMDGDSILAPGGAISNLYSIIVARHKMFPDCKTKGLRALPQQLVLFTSEHVSSLLKIQRASEFAVSNQTH